jgi:hypothetical protein
MVELIINAPTSLRLPSRSRKTRAGSSASCTAAYNQTGHFRTTYADEPI